MCAHTLAFGRTETPLWVDQVQWALLHGRCALCHVHGQGQLCLPYIIKINPVRSTSCSEVIWGWAYRSCQAFGQSGSPLIISLQQSSQSYGKDWCHEGCHWWSSQSSTISWVPFWKYNVPTLAPEDKKVIRRRRINYVVALRQELQARLPDNLEILRNMALFRVKETMKQNKSNTEMINVAEPLGY